MRKEEILVNGTKIWLTFIQPVFYNSSNNLIESIDKWFCYFNYKENSDFWGEILRDKNNSPILFNSRKDAKQYAINIFNQTDN
jgi:hypothetical protein